MSRIRICQLITELRPSGAERCLYELATRLDRERFDVRVVALRGGQVADWLSAKGIRVTVLGMGRKWHVWKLAKLAGEFRRNRPDILHTHLFHADLAGRLAAEAVGLRHIVNTVHIAEARFRPWHFAIPRLLSGPDDRIIAVSQAVRDYHARRSGIPLGRYRVILNGIDADSFIRDDTARSDLRRQWGIPAGAVLLAFVGRLDNQKGVDLLLSAMSHLGARGKPANLVIAGDGPQRFIVENFIKHGEGGRHTRYLGFMPDVRGMLSAADVFLMPSRWEGFGLAAAEAMAAGLPVVGGRVPGLTEVLDHGRAGMLIEPESGIALAEAIETMSADADLRRRLGAAGAAFVRANFAIGANIAAHEKLYEEIVGKTGD